MIKKFKYVFACTLAALVFAACSDDNKETELNGWTDTAYVYVEGQNLLRETTGSVTVMESEGLVNPPPIAYSFVVRLSQAVDKDVTVTLATKASGGDADYVLENSMTFNQPRITFPAGQLVSDEIIFTIDPAFLAVIDQQRVYDPTILTASLGDVETTARNVKLSTNTNKVTITCKKTVIPYANIQRGAPANATFMDRSNWVGTTEGGSIMSGTIDNVFDNDPTTSIMINGAPWAITIDLGAETTILGIETKFISVATANTGVELLTSSDGSNWKTHGSITVVREESQRLRLERPATARYLRYKTIASTMPNNVAEMNVYVAQ